jgi:hypothetical protein
MAMRLNKAVIASKIFIAASAITVASLLWRVSLLYQMIDATGTQDKGQIAWITSRADIADTLAIGSTWVWAIGILVFVMFCFYQAYVTLQQQFDRTFKYTIGWTIGGLFVPIVNFFRPWLGLGEIRRTVLAMRGINIKFDAFTLFFTLAYFLTNGVLRVIGRLEEEVGRALETNFTLAKYQSMMQTLANYDFMFAAIIVLMSVITYTYCRSVIVGIEKA